ncbi:MAG: DUF1572 family protein [Planctomycetota bacterium]|nr:DUF1572 family protein [Planctomycetota bacterium]
MPQPSSDLEFIEAIRAEFARYRTLVEKALEQAGDEDFFWKPDADSNSIALIVKHLGGNLQSRWTDFFTTDGEKAWRDRDGEFEERGVTRAELMQSWEKGWTALQAVLDGLTPADLLRVVTIRGHPHTVILALERALAHVAYHAGQVVLLAKARKGGAFTSLSIAKGQSKGSKAK